MSFRCGLRPPPANGVRVGNEPLRATSIFKPDAGPLVFGFDLGTLPTSFAPGACASDKPFFLSAPATDGNYQVSLILGGPQASRVTVRGEARRLYVNQLRVPANGSVAVTFNVHVRLPQIAGSAPPNSPDAKPLEVRLKPREIGALDWDPKLTLEFNGDRPSVRRIEIRRVDDVPTVYLAGDSTVVDQDHEPWAAWGQMLPAFFTDRVSIANEAESGETIRSFMGERRLAKIESTWKRGDFLLVQFNHNDQKLGSGFVSIADYKDALRHYISDAQTHGVTPILVTAMHRRSFDETGHIIATLGGYPDAVREVAAEQHVALIDLNALSKTLFEAMGPQGTLHAFVHYPANTFPGEAAELMDDTHFNNYGAYELARAVVQSIQDGKLPLAKFLRDGLPAFDPGHPDDFRTFTLPPSPSISSATPYGR